MNTEYAEALKELRIAENHFKYAEPEFWESANAYLTAARIKVAEILKFNKSNVI